MKTKNRRVFGSRINFRSLSCAPINELGIVYLFGVLHDTFDFKIESVQAGFPDCVARRQIGKDRWEELRIEFEYSSKSFRTHNHKPEAVDIIICWNHNWPDCPEHIEVIELSSLIPNLESIAEEVKEPRKLSAYNEFCRTKRLEGYSFKQISALWSQRKNIAKEAGTDKKKDKSKLTEYQKFCRDMRLQGKTLSEIGTLWRERKTVK